jgi:hypothetical protein
MYYVLSCINNDSLEFSMIFARKVNVLYPNKDKADVTYSM